MLLLRDDGALQQRLRSASCSFEHSTKPPRWESLLVRPRGAGRRDVQCDGAVAVDAISEVPALCGTRGGLMQPPSYRLVHALPNPPAQFTEKEDTAREAPELLLPGDDAVQRYLAQPGLPLRAMPNRRVRSENCWAAV